MGNLNRGDVILLKGKNDNLVDLGIMHATHSSLTHTAIVVDDDDTIIEAVLPLVRKIKNPYGDSGRMITKAPVYFGEEAKEAAIAKALSYEGDFYDIIGIAELLLFEISTGANRDAVLVLMERWSKNPVLWCSELVGQALSAAGLVLPTQSFVTTPADIGQYLGYREPALMPEGLSQLQWTKVSSPTFKNTQVSVFDTGK